MRTQRLLLVLAITMGSEKKSLQKLSQYTNVMPDILVTHNNSFPVLRCTATFLFRDENGTS